jgi:Leucine-rich repeat (LRR) protein
VQALSLCASPLSEEDQQLLATALTAGVTASTPAVVSSSTADVELRSSSGGSNSGPGTTPAAAAAAAAAAAGGGGTGVEAQAVTARLPLLELELTSLPPSACGTWLQQRGHLEQLRALSLVSWERSDFDRSWGWLTSLVGLQELKLEHSGAPHEDSAPDKLPAALTALSSSLTQLSIHKFGLSGSQAEGLATLSALRRLQLVACRGEENLSCKWLTALQQLTFLDLSGSPVEQLPRNLGQALPDLQVLLVANTWCGKLPKGMTRLTRLDAHGSDSLSDASLAAVCEATGLRQLNLSGCSIKYAACLSACSGLEVLELRGSGARGWDGSSDDSDYGSHRWRRRRRKKRSPRPTLPCLLNLRRLDLSGSDWWVSDLVTMGGLQHLTFLGLSSGLAKEDGVSSAGSLPALGVLPALQQLDLSCVGVDGRQWPAVGAWLGQQPQLTRLSLSLTAQPYCQPDAERQAQGLALLPTQLVELDLSHCGLQRLPPRLSQMTNLRILLAGHNQDLPAQLPAWLPELQQLEALQVHAVDKRVAEVLRQLPRLREFDGTDREVMYELMSDLWRGLPHLRGRLCFGGLFPDPSELDMYWQL